MTKVVRIPKMIIRLDAFNPSVMARMLHKVNVKVEYCWFDFMIFLSPRLVALP